MTLYIIEWLLSALNQAIMQCIMFCALDKHQREHFTMFYHLKSRSVTATDFHLMFNVAQIMNNRDIIAISIENLETQKLSTKFRSTFGFFFV